MAEGMVQKEGEPLFGHSYGNRRDLEVAVGGWFLEFLEECLLFGIFGFSLGKVAEMLKIVYR